MTTMQLFQIFLGIAGLLGAQTTVLALCINAKIDPLSKQVDMLVQYMVSHEGKIAMLTEGLNGN